MLAAAVSLPSCDLHALSALSVASYWLTRDLPVRQFTIPVRPVDTNKLSTLAVRFYGASENKREVDMDMREMVDKVKKGEPLYGVSSLTEHMQGVATRNSRYSAMFIHVVPWFNFVNHPYVCTIIEFWLIKI